MTVTCVVCGLERESNDPQAYEDEVCRACRGKRRIARMIDVIKRDMRVQQYEWDGTPVADDQVAKKVLSKSTAFLDAYNRTTKASKR